MLTGVAEIARVDFMPRVGEQQRLLVFAHACTRYSRASGHVRSNGILVADAAMAVSIDNCLCIRLRVAGSPDALLSIDGYSKHVYVDASECFLW